MKFSNKNRNKWNQILINNPFDVLIIGGGITGAGIAFDAALRGLRPALVEMQDFAEGTSSRSTKLVHGGLRYLKQFEVQMVAEVGKEREIVYENGPHVTTPVWMLLPIHKGGTFGKYMTSVGLRIYDFLAGVKKSERRRMLSAQETLYKEPLLKKENLIGSGYYVEYRTDDARLTIEVIKAAVEKGAVCLNYLEVKELKYAETGIVCGASVIDQLSGQTYDIHAEKVVNATGPWVDTIRKMDAFLTGKTLRLTKGVHLVIDQKQFPLKQAVYFETQDGRMIFAIPRDRKIYVGTTDTFFNHDPKEARITSADRNYLLNAIHYMFPSVKINDTDIEAGWVGVRPLILEEGKNPSEISRKDEIWESSSGLITIAGGKLTGYRKMAEMVVDKIIEKWKPENRGFRGCSTRYCPISGGQVNGSRGFKIYIEKQVREGMNIGLTYEEAVHLTSIYGSNVPDIFEIIRIEKSLYIQSKLPIILWAKLQYALEYEMTATPNDFFNRRTGTLAFDIPKVRKYKTDVLRYMGQYFQWSEESKELYKQQLDAALMEAVNPIDR